MDAAIHTLVAELAEVAEREHGFTLAGPRETEDGLEYWLDGERTDAGKPMIPFSIKNDDAPAAVAYVFKAAVEGLVRFIAEHSEESVTA